MFNLLSFPFWFQGAKQGSSSRERHRQQSYSIRAPCCSTPLQPASQVDAAARSPYGCFPALRGHAKAFTQPWHRRMVCIRARTGAGCETSCTCKCKQTDKPSVGHFLLHAELLRQMERAIQMMCDKVLQLPQGDRAGPSTAHKTSQNPKSSWCAERVKEEVLKQNSSIQTVPAQHLGIHAGSNNSSFSIREGESLSVRINIRSPDAAKAN